MISESLTDLNTLKFKIHKNSISSRLAARADIKIRDVEAILDKCWITICDASPAFNQHCFTISMGGE